MKKKLFALVLASVMAVSMTHVEKVNPLLITAVLRKAIPQEAVKE